MIVGSGLLANAFSDKFKDSDRVLIYSAGVSNSNCKDVHEFEREKNRLSAALDQYHNFKYFVYFSTCSVNDPDLKDSAYVKHKLSMEKLVRSHKGYLILRLSQVAGFTPNPHTLLNYLYARVSRSEKFNLWKGAKRNIIDCDDIVKIAACILESDGNIENTFNIANTKVYSTKEIVREFEAIANKNAIYEVVDKGSYYPFDVENILPYIQKANVDFNDDYLKNVLRKYYGSK